MEGEPGTQPAPDDVVADDVVADEVIARNRRLSWQPRSSEAPSSQERQRLARSLAEMARSGARATGRGVRATGRGVRVARRRVGSGTGWLASEVAVMAPRLGCVTRPRCRHSSPGGPPRTSRTRWSRVRRGRQRRSAQRSAPGRCCRSRPPSRPRSLPETLALVGIEIKLVAELHGMLRPALQRERGRADECLCRRLGTPPGCLHGPRRAGSGRWLPAGTAAAPAARGPGGPDAFSLGPLLTGAVAGAVLNGRETHRLGHGIRSDLRRHPGM